jgi:hypothetical protein
VHTSADVTLRPSWRKYGRSVLLRFTPAVVIYVALQFWLAGQSGGRDSAYELLPIGLLVLALVADVAFRMGTVVRVTANHVSIEPPLIGHKVVSRQHVRGVALRGVFSNLGARVYAVIYDDHNRSIATLPEEIWDEDALRRLQASLGVDNHAMRYVTASELSREFPGALTISRYAGWVLAFVVTALIFVGVGLQNR